VHLIIKVLCPKWRVYGELLCRVMIVAIKSGWDEQGISYDMFNITFKCLMSGGIQDVRVEDIHAIDQEKE